MAYQLARFTRYQANRGKYGLIETHFEFDPVKKFQGAFSPETSHFGL